MNRILLFCLLLCSVSSFAQGKDEREIIDMLGRQTEAWNRGDLDNFMVGYWNNDSLMFIGKTGVTYGWKNTLENYKKGYPDTASMGKLKFTLISVKKLSPQYCHVVGKWHLQRVSKGDLSGHYTLLFRKIAGKWVIITDHSS